MTDTVFYPASRVSGAASRFKEFVARLRHSFERATIADEAHRTLDALPDNLLRDLGLARGDIPFVASELVSSERRRGAAQRRLPHVVIASRAWP